MEHMGYLKWHCGVDLVFKSTSWCYHQLLEIWSNRWIPSFVCIYLCPGRPIDFRPFIGVPCHPIDTGSARCSGPTLLICWEEFCCISIVKEIDPDGPIPCANSFWSGLNGCLNTSSQGIWSIRENEKWMTMFISRIWHLYIGTTVYQTSI